MSTREIAKKIVNDRAASPLDAYRADLKLVDDISAALQQREQEVRERCAQIAETPYGDDVRAMAGDEPRAVGQKIADAIRRDSEQEGESHAS
jgi:hypothetical protein